MRKRTSWYKKYGCNSKGTGLARTDNIEVILCQTVNEDSKGESEEDNDAEYIQEIDMCQTDKLQFPQIVEMFMYTNIFIADTGASVDSTGHIQILINKRKPGKSYLMTLPDLIKTATEIIYYLRGSVCDNQGSNITKVMLSKVRYPPENKSNIFSVTDRLMNGWNLGGDGN